MDEDLANIIRQVLADTKAKGRDDGGQTETAIKTVLTLRPDMSAADARNAIILVRWFL